MQAGALVLEEKSRWYWGAPTGEIRLHVTVPALRALSVYGAGDVSISGVAGGDLAISLRGAGNLAAIGTVETLQAEISGAGNMELSRLIAVNATVAVNGAGNLQVHATGKLDATLNGVASISYGGKPTQVQTDINGVGSISPK